MIQIPMARSPLRIAHGVAGDVRSQRTTLVPPYDPEVYAQERMKAAAADEADISGIRSTRGQLGTLRDFMAKDDFEVALALAVRLRADRPEDIELDYYIEDCTLALVDRYQARLGALDRIPILKVKRNQLTSHQLDPFSAFLLSHMDGVINLEAMLDISGSGRLETLRHLVKLLDGKIIEVY
jgi:hypothetical protein